MAKKKFRILVVDDSDATRYLIKHTLSRAGYEVIEAANAEQAFSLASSDVHLIVMDIALPDMDGFELTRKLRAQPSTSHISIVQLSAVFASYTHVRDGLRNGADAYFALPLDPASLLSTVKKLTSASA